MSLSAGTVTVNDDLTHSGSGLALAIFESLETAIIIPNDPPPHQPGGLNFEPLRLGNRRSMALLATSLAAGIISYITANAEVSVTVSAADAGLQRMPASTAHGTPTEGPAAPVALTTKGTIS